MALGERGGFTATAEQGFDAIETFKHSIADQVRLDILGWLEGHSTWHRDDLRIPLASADKNVLGAVVNGLIRSGKIVETGERRKSSDPAAHGRKSNVYRLKTRTDGNTVSSGHRSGSGGIADPPEVSMVSTVTGFPSKNEVWNLGKREETGSGVSIPEPARLFDLGEAA